MFNPEFRRYVWLELSRHRLIAVPLLVGVIVLVVLASSETASEILAYGALGFYSLVTICYGAMRALGSVSEELQDRTWDFQRMSALSPWTLAMGKLLGAPIFAWYMGAWLFLVFVVSALAMPEGFKDLGAVIVCALAGTLLLHALAFAAGAAQSRLGMGSRARRASVWISFIALANILPVLFASFFSRHSESGAEGEAVVRFFSVLQISVVGLIALSTVVFCVWALLAAWRMMARELRESPWWWVWPAFALFTGVWLWGIQAEGSPRLPLQFIFIAATFIMVFAAYTGLLLDPLTTVAKTRFARLRQSAQPVSWDKKLPQWLIHVAVAAGFAVLCVVLEGAIFASTSYKAYNLNSENYPTALTVALPLVLMFVRDAAIVTCFTLSSRVKRPLAMAIFYIALLDFLVPFLFVPLNLTRIAHFLSPLFSVTAGLWQPAVFMAIHAAIALGVLAMMHGKQHQTVSNQQSI